MIDDVAAEVQKRFKIICRKCGSEDCVFDFEPEHQYSEMTMDRAGFSFGCNACKQNDYAGGGL